MAFISLLGFIIFVISIVLIIKAAVKKDKSKSKRNLVILAVGFIVFVIGISTMPKSTPTSVNNKTDLKTLVSKNFQDGKLTVDTTNNIATIQFTVDSISENNFVTQMLYLGKQDLSKVYKNEEFKKYQTVRLEGMTTFIDQYGKESKNVGMKLTFPKSELQKVQSFDNISNEQFILLQSNNRTYVHPAIGKNLKNETRQVIFPNN